MILVQTRMGADKDIGGINVNNIRVLISQMADDTTIFLDSIDSIPPLIQLLKAFALCSGLKINVEKTEAYCVGQSRDKAAEDYGLKWVKGPMRLLGISLLCDAKKNFIEG